MYHDGLVRGRIKRKPPAFVIVFLCQSTCTVLRILYDQDGNWRITPLARGPLFVRIDQTDGRDSYSDVAWLGAASWVVHGRTFVASRGE
ncbi:MAG: hypothetical protein KY410_01720, partial [Proteobacteria bacterium]|nr:hypothetical protein [Pseudomonadota bacterium]